MKRHRKSEGFNLAFLDIMSCGLGAVVLVFMLVKHNVENAVVETDLLTQDVQRLQNKEEELQATLSALRDVSKSEAEKIAQLKAKVAALQQELKQNNSSLVDKKDKLAALKSDIKTAPRAKKEDVIKDDRGGEENYLMGLKVEGRKIAILLDTSASMSDEKLLDIIRRKNSDALTKKSGPKWVRTQKVVKWLLARVPAGSQTSLVSFNEQAKVLGNGSWFDARNANALNGVYQELGTLIPTGPTNLQKGLKAVATLNPTDLYVITDGLPTVGDSSYGSLNPFASCSSLLGKSSTISGECRVKLFEQTLKDNGPKGVKINVVLLPLEGDPDAANEYWKWSSLTGGLLISPAVNWP